MDNKLMAEFRFKLEAVFSFGDKVNFDPVADLEAEYYIHNPTQTEGLPETYVVEKVSFEKTAESLPKVEKWTAEEALLHGIFGSQPRKLITEEWKIHCSIFLEDSVDPLLVCFWFAPKQGSSIGETFSCEIESKVLI